MTAKKTLESGLSGVGNKALHQFIISDLIFGVRKKLVKEKKASKYAVLSEITLKELGYTAAQYFIEDGLNEPNIDFVVIDRSSNDLLFLAEIENEKVSQRTLKKIEVCLKKIPTIKEAYIIKFDRTGKTTFELCTIENKKLKITEVTSKSEFLDMSLKYCFISTRIQNKALSNYKTHNKD
ncbi:MAG: hypothetical protein COW03_11285 [Cytophagales bacterium CG12_big_fil_rev_8_21_14_0_65_40_12]|nr:MAG: hypothetical protein COW03_11285 [Cytophagales bacterium CG12_big_fil_rev_8_21_14_0_65_40_12]PIW03533.1 MAG: hypothetical protein COW40_14500 [Cytophagales bacterium CG17_big_fil_post_rev_8_21_14_2_50_40_13]